VVRELLLGPKRFTDLRTALPRVSPDVLAQRLRELEQAGIVFRRKLAPPAASRVYELTAWGEELEPVILALGRWGSRTPLPQDGDAVFGVDSVILALKTLYEPNGRAENTLVELRLGEQRFGALAGGERLEIIREPSAVPLAIIETDPSTLAGLLWHGRSLRGAIRSGDVKLEGQRAAAERFLTFFPLPDPAPGTA
jgi:DNA-binding HxlR family transcriptional regulator